MWIINENALQKIPLSDMFEPLPSVYDLKAAQELFYERNAVIYYLFYFQVPLTKSVGFSFWQRWQTFPQCLPATPERGLKQPFV